MNVQHITGNGACPLGEIGDHEYLVVALRGSSFGTGALVELQYSPDGTAWAPVEGLGSAAATSPLTIGSLRTIRLPLAPLRLVVSGATGGTDFFADFAVALW